MILRNEDYNNDGPITIYAILTRKQYYMVTGGRATLVIPSGVSMKNKTGSRALFFECENRDLAETMEDALDVDGISWQECL